MNLSELAKKHNTDKLLHGYTEFYPRYMESCRDTAKKVVEIGIGLGASARLWLEYFPTAHIYVVDNDPKAIATVWDSVKTGRLTIIQADQTDPSIWQMVGGDIDFVIDDGSHRPEHQIQTFMNGFKYVKPGGWWAVEDIHCSFHPNFSDDPTMLFSWLKDRMEEQQTFQLNDDDFYMARRNYTGISTLIYSYAVYRAVIMFERAND
jgi:trans-aconitate methyltransferase